MYLQVDLQVRARLLNCSFFLRKRFLMWVGEGVSQNPGGWEQFTPPPSPSITNQRPVMELRRFPVHARLQPPPQWGAIRGPNPEPVPSATDVDRRMRLVDC